MILLAITLSHCSTPTTTFKKDDRGQFKDDILEVDLMKELNSTHLPTSSRVPKGIHKIDKRKTRGPASIESAESFRGNDEDRRNDRIWGANKRDWKEIKGEEERNETLADIEGLPEEEPFEDLDDEDNLEKSDLAIETPDEIKNIILSDEPSPFEIKELPPELKLDTTPQDLFPKRKMLPHKTSWKDLESKIAFPHKVPVIKEGSL